MHCKQSYICVSQGSAATYSGEVPKLIFGYEIFLLYCAPKIIKIGLFSPTYSKYIRGPNGNVVFETQCRPMFVQQQVLWHLPSLLFGGGSRGIPHSLLFPPTHLSLRKFSVISQLHFPTKSSPFLAHINAVHRFAKRQKLNNKRQQTRFLLKVIIKVFFKRFAPLPFCHLH